MLLLRVVKGFIVNLFEMLYKLELIRLDAFTDYLREKLQRWKGGVKL